MKIFTTEAINNVFVSKLAQKHICKLFNLKYNGFA